MAQQLQLHIITILYEKRISGEKAHGSFRHQKERERATQTGYI
jgi:hypothetical protein